MAKKEHIVRYTTKEIRKKIARGEDKTDLAKAATVTDAALEASIAADPDEATLTFDWDHATIEVPQTKAVLNMRVDPYVLDFFKQTGRGYQTRIHAVLKAFVDAQAHKRT